MGDLLLRGIDNALKVALQESARRNGRSLSDEAIVQIRSALTDRRQGVSAGSRLREIVGDDIFTDEELSAIEMFRRTPDRNPPLFA